MVSLNNYSLKIKNYENIFNTYCPGSIWLVVACYCCICHTLLKYDICVFVFYYKLQRIKEYLQNGGVLVVAVVVRM